VGLPGGVTKVGKPDLLAVAASLRWARPDLTAALADHVLEWASMAGDRDLWLTAAGWALNARLATGDGRDMASDIVEALPRWGTAPLTGAPAHRLRVELALAAGRVGERDLARALVAPVTADGTAPETQADAFCVLARCAVDDAPDLVADALRQAEHAWSQVEPPCREIGAASVALVRAAAQRQADRPDAAVEHAAEGLARLDRSRGSGTPGTPSAHLAAALAAEWISALLDAGRLDEAREGCVPLMPRLAEPARPSRHLARLRLTVARTVTTDGVETSTVEALEQAAGDAADSDVADLEAVCRSALAAVHEKAGRSAAAREAMRLGDAAEGRDSDRSRRLRAALAALPVGTLPTGQPTGAGEDRRAPGRNGADLPTDPLNDDLPGEWTVGWTDLSGDSPIGDLLVRSLRSGPNGPGHGEDLGVAESDPQGAVWSDSSRLGDRWPDEDWSGEGSPTTVDGWRDGPLDDRPEDDQPAGADSLSSNSGGDLSDRRGKRDRTAGDRGNDDPLSAAYSSARGSGRDLLADAGRRPGPGRSERDRREDGSTGPAGDLGDDLFEPGRRGRSDDHPPDDQLNGADLVTHRAGGRRNGWGSRGADDDRRDEDPLSGLDWLNGRSNGVGRGSRWSSGRSGRDVRNGGGSRGRSDRADDDMLTSAEWLAGASRRDLLDTTPATRGRAGTDRREDDPLTGADRFADSLDGGAPGAGRRGRWRSGTERPAPDSLTAEDWLSGRSGGDVRRNGRGSVRSGGERRDERGPTGASNGRSLREGLTNGRRIGRSGGDRQDDDSLTGVDWLAGGPRSDVFENESGPSGGDRRHDEPLTAADWLAGGLYEDVLGTSGRRRAHGGRPDDGLGGERSGSDGPDGGDGTHSSEKGERATNGTSGSWWRRGEGSGRGADRSSRAAGRPGAADQGGDADGGHRRRDEVGPGRADTPRNGRRKHRLDDPWATGQWSVVPSGDEQTEGAPGGRRSGGSAAIEPAPTREPAVSAATNSDAWLSAALADLERIRQRPNPTGAAPVLEPVGPDVEGSVVAIDVVRDGRRYAGRRAAAVVRALADRLIDRLPSGARLRFDEADALSVVLSGWERGDAAAWMHRTLPGLLTGVTTADDMPGAHLRAAVHDADGPVGAQILQRLDSGDSRSGEARTATNERKHAGRAANGRGAHGIWGDLGAAARSAERDTGTVNGSGRRRSRESSPGPTRDSDRGDSGDLARNGGSATRSGRDSGRGEFGDAPGNGGLGARSVRDSGREDLGDALTTRVSAAGPSRDTGREDFGGAPRDGGSAARSTRDPGPEDSGDAPGKGASRSGSEQDGDPLRLSSRSSGRDRSSADTASSHSAVGTDQPGGSDARESSGERSRGDRAGRVSGSGAGNGSAGVRESSGGRSRRESAGSPSGAGAESGSARDTDPAGSSRTRGRGDSSRSADKSSGDATAGSRSTSGGVTGRDSGGESAAGGRHDAAGRAPFRAAGVDGETGSAGNRHRRSGTESPSQPAQAEAQSTEGLGIADLLAGALAAYRGI
jgi:hypothetical protein